MEEYYSDGKNRFMRLPAPENGADTYKIRMMNMNSPESLLHLHLSYEGTKACYDYNVTGLVSLKDSAELPLQGEFLYSIVFGLEHLADVLCEHLLSEEELNLNPEAVFLQMDTGRVFFCYTPGTKASFGESIRHLMEYFMKALNPEKEEDVLLLYGLYQKSREPKIGLSTLAEFWRKSRGKRGFGSGETFEESDKHEIQEDDYVFQDLGITTTKEKGLYSEWKGKQDRSDGTCGWIEACEEKESRIPTVDEVMDVESGGNGKSGNQLLEKILKKAKEYKFEIIIGLVVLIGVLVLLFTNG